MAAREPLSTPPAFGVRAHLGCAAADAPRPAVIIVINALHSGGAEKTCVELARSLRHSHDVQVIGLLSGGPTECELRALGVGVMVPRAASGAWVKLRLAWDLIALVARKRPAMVISFLYAADFIAGVLSRIVAPRTEIFWNIRCNVLAPDRMSALSRLFARLDAWVSPLVPNGIVYCSKLARQQHEDFGYRSRRSYIVENSAAAVPFAFSLEKRAKFRYERALDRFTFLFVGRFDPVKRIDMFIDACAQVERAHPGRARFLIAGRDMEASNPRLAALLERSATGQSFGLLGYVSDQQALYSAADCLVVTSESEGSPNVVYEAIATRLQTLILATLGTESISGYGVRRLASRSLDELADVMMKMLAGGIPQDSTRVVPGGGTVALEHPLVSFYKSVLTIGPP